MPPRRLWLVPVVLVALALLVSGAISVAGTDTRTHDDVQYVEVANGTLLWPYTSHSPSFRGQTLAINVVVYGEPTALKRHLTDRAIGDWNETEEEAGDVHPIEGSENETSPAWADARGATRYTYVNRPDDQYSRWLDESYQLHDGDYFGARHHLRVYESPADDEAWVAVQAHHEHWDWFRLRHTVDGVQSAQGYVEQEFMERRYVSEVSRVFVPGAQGTDMDGWVTVIRFGERDRNVVAAAVLAVGLPALRRLHRAAAEPVRATSKRSQRMAVLATAIPAVYLGVRFGAIGIERYVPGLEPAYVAVLFYPVLLVGLPACAYGFARRLDRQAGFVAAAAGFIAAVLFDYAYLQIAVLPIDTIVHRLVLAGALGLIATGASQSAWQAEGPNPYLRMGLLLWLSALGLPLIRFV